jgi:hypothetical protein
MGLAFDRMGEEGIDLLVPEKTLRDFLNGQHDRTGGKILGDCDSLPEVILIGKDPDGRWLDPDFQGKLAEEFAGMDGD